MDKQNSMANIRQELKIEVELLALLEKISWRQKYIAVWLKEGDSNTKFLQRLFESSTNYHVSCLKVDCTVYIKESVIHEQVVSFCA